MQGFCPKKESNCSRTSASVLPLFYANNNVSPFNPSCSGVNSINTYGLPCDFFFFFLSLVLYNVLMAMCAYFFSQMISFTLLDLGGRTEIWFQFNDTEFLQEMVRQPGNFFPHGVFACSPINFISHVTVQFHFVSFHFPWKADSDP